MFCSTICSLLLLIEISRENSQTVFTDIYQLIIAVFVSREVIYIYIYIRICYAHRCRSVLYDYLKQIKLRKMEDMHTQLARAEIEVDKGNFESAIGVCLYEYCLF